MTSAKPAEAAERHPPSDIGRSILETARDLLAEGGVDRLSMRQVAERVGVSAAAIYHHFENKQDLVDRVVTAGFEEFGVCLEQAMAEHPKGSLERIRAGGRAYLRFALENEAYFRVIFSIQPRGPRAVEDLPAGGGYFLLRQSVVDAMEAGTMRRADPDLMSMYLWCSVHGLVTLVLSGAAKECRCEGEYLTPEELHRSFGPLIRDGIRARPGLEDVSRGAETA